MEISKEEYNSEAYIDKLINNGKGYKYANASKIFNTLQRYNNALIIDLRSCAEYNQTHMQCSINLSPENVQVKDFETYSPEVFMERFLSGTDKAKFQKRKRLFVFLIASQNCVKGLLTYPRKIAQILNEEGTCLKYNMKMDGIGLICSLLLYKGLKSERMQEVYIFPQGFVNLMHRYPFLCLYHGVKIYLEPYIV